MVMAAGQDDDRMRKMREITDLEAKDAAKQQAKQMRVNHRAAQKLGQIPDTKSEKVASGDTKTETAKAAAATASGSKPSASGDTKSTATAAKATGATPAQPAEGSAAGAPPAKPAEGNAAGATTAKETPKAAAGAAPNKATTKPTKEQAVQAQLEAENELQDSANPEAPKSKEILMMELKRITELRSMLMQMVNEILRKSNENVRNIWRG